MIKISINCKKIPKERLFEGRNGKYLNAILVDKPDDYGNDGFISMDVSKEERERGVKGEIIGNWKHLGAKPEPPRKPQSPRRPPATKPPPAERTFSGPTEDIPF